MHQHVLDPAEVVCAFSTQPLQCASEDAPLLRVEIVAIERRRLRSTLDRPRSAARVRPWTIDGALDRLLGVFLDFGDDYILGICEQPLEIFKVIPHLRCRTNESHQDLRVTSAALRISDHQLRGLLAFSKIQNTRILTCCIREIISWDSIRSIPVPVAESYIGEPIPCDMPLRCRVWLGAV